MICYVVSTNNVTKTKCYTKYIYTVSTNQDYITLSGCIYLYSPVWHFFYQIRETTYVSLWLINNELLNSCLTISSFICSLSLCLPVSMSLRLYVPVVERID